jgi:hypothetical protein
MFQKIYGVGKVKFQTNWPDKLKKNTNLVENFEEINLYTIYFLKHT